MIVEAIASVIVESLATANTLESTISWIIEKYQNQQAKDISACKEMIYSIFVAIPFSITREKMKLYGKSLGFTKDDIKQIVSQFDFEKYYSLPPHLRSDWILTQYQHIFCKIHRAWDSQNYLFEDEQDASFFRLVHRACEQWENNLFQARNKFSALENLLSTNETKTLSKQIGQLAQQTRWKPHSFFGGDKSIATKIASNDSYVPQKIIFYPKDLPENTPSNSFIFARPEKNTPEGMVVWWSKLAKNLKKPLYLFGPGGMGKSAFLAYLYQCISQDQSGIVPFSGVFLLSLESLSLMDPSDYDNGGMPLANPEKSLLLSRISSRSGRSQDYTNWDIALRTGAGLDTDKPILLLLDGLNELRQGDAHSQLYRQILQEISALSQYPYINIIITSRVENLADPIHIFSKDNKELLSQLKDFQASALDIETARLDAIEPIYVKQLIFNIALNIESDLKLMIQRPLYYNYIKNLKNISELPNNKYSLLQKMYQRIFEQSVDNTQRDEEKNFRTYVYHMYLPILAHVIQNGDLTAEIAFQNTSLIAINQLSIALTGSFFKMHDPGISLEFIRSKLKKVEVFLEHQEQILTIDDEQHIAFIHQDYRDFLAAYFFIQRLGFVKDHITAPVLTRNQSLQLDSLRLNTYTFDVLRLIYDGVQFSNNYVKNFTILENVYPQPISWEYLVWYTTAYQLSDLRNLSKIPYPTSKNFALDTISVLEPFVQAVMNEVEKAPRKNRFFSLCPSTLMIQNTIEILMKDCEMFRSLGQYDQAFAITDVAQKLCSDAREMSNLKGADRDDLMHGADLMQSVVSYNVARLHMCQFATTKSGKHLAEALSALYSGTQDSPYRFSCSALALMIVSPQPILAETQEYRAFRKKENLNMISAFWMYYNAIFDERKQGESWLPRQYAIRQFLFLLAENKVQIVPCNGWNPSKATLESLIKGSRTNRLHSPFYVREGIECDPIPSANNLRLIQSILNQIWHMDWPWKLYLAGLVEAELNNNIQAAKADMDAAYSKFDNMKAKMWLEYFNDNLEGMDEALQALKNGAKAYAQKILTFPLDISGYNLDAYFKRDNVFLYEKLKGRLQLNYNNKLH